MADDHGKIEVDFRRKEAELGWMAVMDRFALNATPVWFSWIGWIFALSAIQFLYQKSQSIFVIFIIALSYCFIWIYFIAFFYRIEFRGFPLIQNPNMIRFLSMLTSGLLSFAAFSAARLVAQEIARLQAAG